MLETLYKTRTPELGRSECYEISVSAVRGSGPRRHVFRQHHGWWEESTKTFIHEMKTIDTSEEPVTFEEAEAMYTEARKSLARNGFVHSFAPNYYGGAPPEYTLVEC